MATSTTTPKPVVQRFTVVMELRDDPGGVPVIIRLRKAIKWLERFRGIRVREVADVPLAAKAKATS